MTATVPSALDGKTDAEMLAEFRAMKAERTEQARAEHTRVRQAAWVRAKRGRLERQRVRREQAKRAATTERFEGMMERSARRRSLLIVEREVADLASDALEGLLERDGFR